MPIPYARPLAAAISTTAADRKAGVEGVPLSVNRTDGLAKAGTSHARLGRWVAVAATCALLTGCGTHGAGPSAHTASDTPVPGLPATAAEPTAAATTPTAVDLKAAALAKAAAAGEAPTEAGVSEPAREPDRASFLWESTKGHLCLAQTALSGGFDTLSPALTGRDLYYVQLPDAPKGDLDVTLDVGGQQKQERLHFT
ncbi:hypothetical protein ACIQU4_12450 [Streptomyces sp. NPDC090741]|uniref:hypothetical protein n=1 Tax=Streptomyces sp. NPDC090741 TaxID=3365967 RepID=UPI00382E1605